MPFGTIMITANMVSRASVGLFLPLSISAEIITTSMEITDSVKIREPAVSERHKGEGRADDEGQRRLGAHRFTGGIGHVFRVLRQAGHRYRGPENTGRRIPYKERKRLTLHRCNMGPQGFAKAQPPR